jgi:hypothetical protein
MSRALRSAVAVLVLDRALRIRRIHSAGSGEKRQSGHKAQERPARLRSFRVGERRRPQ